jgi:lipoprotein-anchoring transpeptidase ErfK/SrfK
MEISLTGKRIVAVGAACVAAVALTSCSGGTPAAKGAGSVVRTASVPVVGAGSTLLATPNGAIPGYAHPGGAETGLVPASWHGAVSTLPVIATKPGWLDVRLATRPNESTTWVHIADVSLTSTPYRIVVDIATTHLSLYKSGRLVFTAPAGVGTTTDPTPTGEFFVAFFAAAPSPGYGAFVMVSSAHSNTISDWESSGDALMAIHGPLGADAQIGTTGTRVSHGCVRLHEADLVRLRSVPAGSPIDVVTS